MNVYDSHSAYHEAKLYPLETIKGAFKASLTEYMAERTGKDTIENFSKYVEKLLFLGEFNSQKNKKEFVNFANLVRGIISGKDVISTNMGKVFRHHQREMKKFPDRYLCNGEINLGSKLDTFEHQTKLCPKCIAQYRCEYIIDVNIAATLHRIIEKINSAQI